ncbi:hypothetical protein HKX48_008009 [Thoreauomyces humboldtii]|nr:hypothetical protein HKX48_008009 [Thoreauomyces humboldtii]
MATRTTYPPERRLQDRLIVKGIPDFPELVARDWEVQASRTDMGVGDLVFANKDKSRFMVVETRVLKKESGRTARGKRTKARQRVEEQAWRYGKAWALKHPETTVECCTYVEEKHGDAELRPVTTFMPHAP